VASRPDAPWSSGTPFARKELLAGQGFASGHAQKALRRAQLVAAGAAQASQLALFAALHDDDRPPCERTAAGRYLQPGLFENQVAQTRESRP